MTMTNTQDTQQERSRPIVRNLLALGITLGVGAVATYTALVALFLFGNLPLIAVAIGLMVGAGVLCHKIVDHGFWGVIYLVGVPLWLVAVFAEASTWQL